jgi:hypothetical protein
MRVPRQNQLTYEEIEKITGLAPSKINNYIESAYNKMGNYLVDEKKCDIFDAIKWLKMNLGMSDNECVEKLSISNHLRLKKSLEDQDLFR